MVQKKILITGGQGQLAKSFRIIETGWPQFELIYLTKNELDITNHDEVNKLVPAFDAIINCAAFTAVDLAESNFKSAWDINVRGTIHLSEFCSKLAIPLIHYSSDYVYDNGLKRALKETDPEDPKSIYANTKFQGEQAAQYFNSKTIIIRTSWVYSEYGQNFVKTILKLISERSELNIVNDQIGAPTYAPDLAEVTLQIIEQVLSPSFHAKHYGIYNFSNKAEISWYDFAQEIARVEGSHCKINPVSTSEFPRPAKRPNYSVFNLNKIEEVFGIRPIDWKYSLTKCLQNFTHGNP